MSYDFEMNKRFNEIIRRSHENSKLDYCLCCGKKVTSFCNSHSIPECILKNISNKGMLYTSNKLFEAPFVKNEKGLNNSGTFKRICRECDNNIFKDYEDLNKIIQEPRKKMMAQIDLKNTIRMYDKRLNEIEYYKILSSMCLDKEKAIDILQRQVINSMDLSEIKTEFNTDLKILSGQSSDGFELIYWEKLEHVTPIAFQGHIALQGDLRGNVINDLYSSSSSYIIENINVCVFPLEDSTIVMLFISKKNKKYKNFIRQFKQLKRTEKLNLISFIIFNYSEDFFLSEKISDDILKGDIVKLVTKNTTNILALDEKMICELKKIKINELMHYKSFPNILDSKYAINN